MFFIDMYCRLSQTLVHLSYGIPRNYGPWGKNVKERISLELFAQIIRRHKTDTAKHNE